MDVKRGRAKKSKRNAKIIKYIESGWKFESIAKKFKISKARVSQIYHSEEVEK